MLFLILNAMLYFSSFTNDKLIFKIVFFIIATYCSMSFGRGFDWINYYDIYQNIELGYYDSPFEPGYYNVLRLFKWLGFSYPAQNFFVIVFLFFCLYKFSIKTKNPSLTFFTLFCFMGHYILSEQVRQAIAICIVFLFFDVFRRRKVLQGVGVIMLAMCFHLSAFLCFLYYVMFNGKDKNTNFKFLLYCSIFLTVSYYVWLNPTLILAIPMLYSKFIGYAESYTEGFFSIEKIVSSKVILIYFLMLFLTLLLLKRTKMEVLNNSIKSLIFMILTKLAVFFGRFQYYMLPLLILGLDDYFHASQRRRKINISRFFYATCLFVISLVPLWSPSTFESINDSLYINASTKEIESAIAQRCKTLNFYDPQNGAIQRCR